MACSTEEKKRETGINVIGAAPWGTHLCQFYNTKQDLLHILVPYFKAGLENNEFCMWVTSEPLGEKEAKEAIRKAVPDFARYLKRGQIIFVPHTEWYLKDGAFDGKRVLNGWIDKLNQALVKGYDGMRVTGNIAWLEKRDWKKFTGYEEELNKVVGDYRILAVCTCPLAKCGASEVMDVVKNHQFALIRREGKWELIESGERKRVEEALRESEEFSSNLLSDSPNPITVINPDSSIKYVNPALEKLTGFSFAELVGRKPPRPWWPEEKQQQYLREFDEAIRKGIHRLERLYQSKNGEQFWVEITSTPVIHNEELKYFLTNWVDITERKRAEEALHESKKMISQATSARQRPLKTLQRRFIKSGFEDWDEKKGVELIFDLCRHCPECDKQIKMCIRHFKTVRELLAASDQELQRAGVCPRGIFTIKLLRELPAEILKQKIVKQPFYKSPKEIFNYLYYSMRDLKKEVFKVIYLNSRNQIIDTEDLFEGTTEGTPVHPREIIEAAFKHDAVRLIFVHNHPSGDPAPSKSDKQLTRDLVFIGNVTQIKVIDHIIMGENRYFSFADAGLIKKYGDDFLNIRIKRMLQPSQCRYPS